MKDLPKVFHNEIDKHFNNNETIFYTGQDTKSEQDVAKKNEHININQKINAIFSAPNYIYKANVEIKLKDKIVTKRIIGRNKDYIITMDNDLIPIKDILDINSKKNK